MFKSSEIKQIFCKTKLVFCNSTLHKTQMLQPKVVQFFPMRFFFIFSLKIPIKFYGFRINLQAKETYFWCSCGLSINQVFFS